ncbi:MAG: response regulator [Defluviitaleaceae bacterium]|nr:response regulator [Defluviitaleaceae bacterium]
MNKKIIFSVDDAETALSIVEEMLNDRYTVISIKTVEEMFERLQATTPDLILLDYYMPDISCQMAMKRLKIEYGAVPVIVVSASNYPDLMDEINAMGAVDFISKPINDMETVFAKVKKWIKDDR